MPESKSPKSAAKNNGKPFERVVAGTYKAYSHSSDVVPNIRIRGDKSKTGRQIDVSVRTEAGGQKVHTIVEAKDKGRNVDVPVVDSLIGMMEDVGADKAVLVSNSGFTETAVTYISNDSRLQAAVVVDVEDPSLKHDVEYPMALREVTHRDLSFAIDASGAAFDAATEDQRRNIMSVLNKDISLLEQMLRSQFQKYWNKNAFLIPRGRRELRLPFVTLAGIAGHVPIVGICTFEKVERLFFTNYRNVLKKCVFDIGEQKVVMGHESYSATLTLNMGLPGDKEGWMEVDPSTNVEGRICYAACDAYSHTGEPPGMACPPPRPAKSELVKPLKPMAIKRKQSK